MTDGITGLKSGTARVSMIEADCPDHYCVDHAAIDKVNETIVCLPHRVVLEITGGGEEKEVDA